MDIDIAARWKTNIDIDIGNINILLQYIDQQYIDLYPWLLSTSLVSNRGTVVKVEKIKLKETSKKILDTEHEQNRIFLEIFLDRELWMNKPLSPSAGATYIPF